MNKAEKIAILAMLKIIIQGILLILFKEKDQELINSYRKYAQNTLEMASKLYNAEKD